MTIEGREPRMISETVEEDPIEAEWYINVQRWVRKEIDYAKLMKSYLKRKKAEKEYRDLMRKYTEIARKRSRNQSSRVK